MHTLSSRYRYEGIPPAVSQLTPPFFVLILTQQLDDKKCERSLRRIVDGSPKPDTALWNSAVWQLDAATHSHDRWIREVVSSLLPYTTTTALQLCHRLVRFESMHTQLMYPRANRA